MVKPTVSIITPTYGRGSFLPLIYYCVQTQEWPNIEWLVDDDSPLPSAFMQTLSDPRVHYFHAARRRSVGAKRNELIRRAKGDYIAHFDDDDYFEGKWNGQIIDERRGNNGFGYDPIFLVPELKMTAAELPAEIKNKVSHRGQAFAQFKKKLGKRLKN